MKQPDKRTTRPPKSGRLPFQIKTLVVVAGYSFVFITIFQNFPHTDLKPHPVLLKSLLSGKDTAYLPQGSEVAAIKPFLPKGGQMSFLTDHPFGVDKEEQKLYWSVSNFLCPMILNPQPVENIAIIYCSTAEIAEKKLRATGYKWMKAFPDGKGVAVKA